MKKYLITLFILACPIFAWAVEEREGYCKIVQITSPQGQPQDVFTVPEGKRFVLLQLIPWGLVNFRIQVDGNDIFDGLSVFYNGPQRYHDFPDRCVTVNSGETLSVLPYSSGSPLQLNIIGYFYDYKRVSRSVADLTNDRKVDFSDFVVLASEWLKDGNINSGA